MLPILLAAFSFLAHGQRVPVPPSPPRCVAVSRAPGAAMATADHEWISGTLVDEWGVPLSGWSVCTLAAPRHGRLLSEGKLDADLLAPFPRSTVTDARGGWRLQRLPSFALLAIAPDESVVALREEFAFDGRAVDLRLRPDDRASAFIQGSASVPTGCSLAQVRVSSQSQDGIESWSADLHEGRFHFGPLRAGEHVLMLLISGFAPLRLPVQLEPHAVLDLGQVAIPRPGYITVDLEHPGISFGPDDVVRTLLHRDGTASTGEQAVIRNGPAAERPVGGGCFSPREPNPRGQSGPLLPGRYLLRTQEADWSARDTFVDVVSGSRTTVRLVLERRHGRRAAGLQLKLPQGDPSIRLLLNVTDARGVSIRDEHVFYRTDDSFFVYLGVLEGGVYDIEARSGAGSAIRTTFEIESFLTEDATLVLELR